MTFAMKRTERYTYADYLQWDDGERWELINGIAYNMSPAPSRIHQEISLALSLRIGNYLAGKQCKLYVAPFDVRLPLINSNTDSDITNVVQPDLVVVCDLSKLDERGCFGAPDLVIEILSPSTAKIDMVYKLNLYEQAGVREYWLVHPTDQTILVFRLNEGGKYGRHELYERLDKLITEILPEFTLDLAEVFA